MLRGCNYTLYLHLYSKYKRKYCFATFILTPFSNLAQRRIPQKGQSSALDPLRLGRYALGQGEGLGNIAWL